MLVSRRVVILTLIAIIILAVSGEPEQRICNNNDGNDKSCLAEGNIETEDQPEPPGQDDDAVTAIFHNQSPHRADIHYDDGRYGQVVGTADANGGQLKQSTFQHHRFFATMHGVRNSLVDPSSDEQYFFTVTKSRGTETFVLGKTAAPSTKKCKDRYPFCVDDATRGECTVNPGWMIVNCCESCENEEGYGYLIDSKVRCDPERLNSTIPAWKIGSLDDLFIAWSTDDKYKQYEPRVVSSPDKVHGAEYDGPWVMTFDNFLDNFEIEQLIEGASFEGFKRSTDQGNVIGGSGERERVTSTGRTSTNAWCRDQCESLPGVQRVTKRIEEVTGIPQNNYESFQLLQYQEGQFYRSHHDSSGGAGDEANHRILTFFLYLNNVDEGGETRFTSLDISVMPKKGRALMWPSVLNEDPDLSDKRMYHEAKEVIKGTKYAANAWIHQYDFKNAMVWGCNGSFA